MPSAIYAQNVTTGSLTGTIRDQQGGVLPGVTVTATHPPTGVAYEGVTQGDGTFTLVNVVSADPTRSSPACQDSRQTETEGDRQPGADHDDRPTCRCEHMTEPSTSPRLHPPSSRARTRAPHGNIEQEFENLPTLQRSLTDFARANPSSRRRTPTRTRNRPQRCEPRGLQQPPDRRRCQ